MNYDYKKLKSFGMIVFSIFNNNVYFLIVQRRDSFEYMDLIRGIWSEGNLQKSFSLITNTERERLRMFDFDELWDDLWCDHTYYLYKDGYERAKKKFQILKPRINELLEQTSSTLLASPWGFPKGKKNHFESEKECSIREFEEETRIHRDALTIIDNSDACFREEYLGTNGKFYLSHYFLAKMDNMIIPKRLTTNMGIRKEYHSVEIEDIKWITLNECHDYNLSPQRVDILRKALLYIMTSLN